MSVPERIDPEEFGLLAEGGEQAGRDWLKLLGATLAGAWLRSRLRKGEKRRVLALIARRPAEPAKAAEYAQIIRRQAEGATQALASMERKRLGQVIDQLFRDDILADLRQRQFDLVSKWRAGKIADVTLERSLRAAWQDTYEMAYLAGKVKAGGDYALTQAEIIKLRAEVKDEKRFWRNAMEALRDPGYWERRGAWRIDLYAQALRGVMNRGFADQEEIIRWRLGVAEHCPDCLGAAAGRSEGLGEGEYYPADLPFAPGDGSSVCNMNCRCWLEAGGMMGAPVLELPRNTLPDEAGQIN